MQQMAMEAVGERPVTTRWGLIRLGVSLGTSRAAMVKFQQTFPDEYHFRTKLIDLALRYELDHVESVRLIAISCNQLPFAKQRIELSASTSKAIPDPVITCRT